MEQKDREIVGRQIQKSLEEGNRQNIDQIAIIAPTLSKKLNRLLLEIIALFLEFR